MVNRQFFMVISLCIMMVAACTPAPDTLIQATQSLPTQSSQLKGSLPVDETQHGTLAIGSIDGWQFSGVSNDVIVVDALGPELTMTLHDSSGQLLMRGNIIQTTLQTDGLYTINVQSTSGGDYSITLRHLNERVENAITALPVFSPTPDAPLVVGVPTATPPPLTGLFMGDISRVGLRVAMEDGQTAHLYTFEGVAGQYANVTVTTDSLSPRLTLYNPQQQPIGMDAGSGEANGAVLRNVRLPVDGVYHIQISTASPISYEVTVSLYPETVRVEPTQIIVIPPSAPQAYVTQPPLFAQADTVLNHHVPVRAVADTGTYVTSYPVYIEADEMITIGVVPIDDTSAVRPKIELHDPDERMIYYVSSANASNGRDAIIPPMRLPVTGTYRVYVATEGGSTGDYLISAGIGGDTWMQTVGGMAVNDTTYQGEIKHNGVEQIWVLDLRAGDVITVALTPKILTFRPTLSLVPADAPETVIASSGQLPELRQIAIAQTGRYFLRVHGGVGTYDLIWRYVSIAPTPTPIPPAAPIMRLSDEIAEGSYGFYPFYGLEGQTIQIEVISTSADFDPVAVLLNPAGQEIATGDDYANTLNAVFMVTLPLEGLYTVRVNSYLQQGGTFDIRISELFLP